MPLRSLPNFIVYLASPTVPRSLTSQSTHVASRRTRGPISHLGPLSVERDEVTTMTVAVARVFVVPAQCQARHGECHNNVYDPKEIIPPEGGRLHRPLSIACSWTRSVRCPAFHRPNALLASRCASVFSCDMIFTPKFFGLSDTPVAHCFCITDGRRTTHNFD